MEMRLKLEVPCCGQVREQLDWEKYLFDNVSGSTDCIEINGHNKHVIS